MSVLPVLSRLCRLSALAALLAAGASEAIEPAGPESPVALEMVLAIDGSTSVSTWEYALQTAGLARAFRAPEVVAAIARSGGIAVALVEWAGAGNQALAVDWTAVGDAASAEALAQAIEASPRRFIGNGTALTEALGYAAARFAANGFQGERRVIDVSGDGPDNRGTGPAQARARARAAGITVNGLAILDREPGLAAYYRARVDGGAFVLDAASYRDFAAAIHRKLLREIAGAPVAGVAPPARPQQARATAACHRGDASCNGVPSSREPQALGG